MYTHTRRALWKGQRNRVFEGCRVLDLNEDGSYVVKYPDGDFDLMVCVLPPPSYPHPSLISLHLPRISAPLSHIRCIPFTSPVSLSHTPPSLSLSPPSLSHPSIPLSHPSISLTSFSLALSCSQSLHRPQNAFIPCATCPQMPLPLVLRLQMPLPLVC